MQFLINVVKMNLYGAFRQLKPTADFLIRKPVRQQAQDFPLTPAQPGIRDVAWMLQPVCFASSHPLIGLNKHLFLMQNNFLSIVMPAFRVLALIPDDSRFLTIGDEVVVAHCKDALPTPKTAVVTGFSFGMRPRRPEIIFNAYD